jgi:hypothetical protein
MIVDYRAFDAVAELPLTFQSGGSRSTRTSELITTRKIAPGCILAVMYCAVLSGI